LEQKKFTFTLEIETINRMNSLIYSTSPKYRSQSHFVEVALQKVITEEEQALKEQEEKK